MRVFDAAVPGLTALLAEDAINTPAAWAEIAEVYVPLSAFIAGRHAQRGRTLVVGITGAQGSGKSTIVRWLACLLQQGFGLRAVPYALDDFYLTARQRARLARTVHPLLATRGVPGTHDVALGKRRLQALCNARAGERIDLPAFDKARDDRAPPERARRVDGPVDVVLFEGWCVGAMPETIEALRVPANALEREHDRDGRFRRYVNAQLAHRYGSWFATLDTLVMLCAPAFEVVQRWRWEQEQRLATARPGGPSVMRETEIRTFVAHYERLTRHLLRELPERADVVLQLTPDRRIERVTIAPR